MTPRALNPELPGLTAGSVIVPSGACVHVQLPAATGAPVTYRFTPALTWRCRLASPMEVARLPRAKEQPDNALVTAPGERAKHLLDELLGALGALDEARRQPSGNGAQPIRNGDDHPLPSVKEALDREVRARVRDQASSRLLFEF